MADKPDSRLAVLATHGITGDDATSTLAALDHHVAEGAPALSTVAPWLDTLTDEQRASRLAGWYGHDASRAAEVLCRY